MRTSGDLASSLVRDGFAVAADVLPPDEVDRIVAAVADAGGSGATLRRGGNPYGMRDLLRGVAEVGRLAGSPPFLDLADAVIGPGAFAVRGLWFDKTEGANWGVPWHQDTTIAVREKVATPDFGPWTSKAGITHVRPPAAILDTMVILRVHLDDCGEANGPLRVIPGSHAEGRLDAESTAIWLAQRPPVDCLVPRGGVLMMRPLLLHASSAALVPRHRRVLHLEYAAGPLPGGLEWFECIGRVDR